MLIDIPLIKLRTLVFIDVQGSYRYVNGDVMLFVKLFFRWTTSWILRSDVYWTVCSHVFGVWCYPVPQESWVDLSCHKNLFNERYLNWKFSLHRAFSLTWQPVLQVYWKESVYKRKEFWSQPDGAGTLTWRPCHCFGCYYGWFDVMCKHSILCLLQHLSCNNRGNTW